MREALPRSVEEADVPLARHAFDQSRLSLETREGDQDLLPHRGGFQGSTLVVDNFLWTFHPGVQPWFKKQDFTIGSCMPGPYFVLSTPIMDRKIKIFSMDRKIKI